MNNSAKMIFGVDESSLGSVYNFANARTVFITNRDMNSANATKLPVYWDELVALSTEGLFNKVNSDEGQIKECYEYISIYVNIIPYCVWLY